jgi:hypothetical protein
VALAMCVPLAVYLWRQARSRLWSWLWLCGGIVIATGAAVTQSRTVPLMLVGMIATALWLRPSGVARRWPLLLVAVAFIHFASPHTLGNLYNSFRPSGGLLSQQEARSGFGGSGRIADIRPGLRLWEQEPVFGRGSGTNPTRGGAAGPQADSTETQTSIIFDDQYMSSLVELGIVGFIAVLWLVAGVVLKLGMVARRTQGRVGDLLVACSAACAGYAVAMATFDAFSFVQVTLLFFVIAALGLQARRIALARGAEPGATEAEGSAPAP